MPTELNTIFTKHALKRINERGFSKRIVIRRLAECIAGNIQPLHNVEYRINGWRIICAKHGEKFVIITVYHYDSYKVR